MAGRLFIAAAAALALLYGSAVAQETQDQKPEQSVNGIETKSLLDNEQMRVMEMRFKPGAKTTSVSHPNRFVYALTDGALVFSPPGKTPYELSFKRGEALWLPADETVTQNDTDKDVRALVVELKGHTASAANGAAKGKHAAKARGKAKTTGSAHKGTPRKTAAK